MVTPRTSTAVSMLSPCDGAKFIRSTYLRIPKRWRAGWSFKPSPASKRPLPNKLLANQLGQHFGNGLGWKIGTFARAPGYIRKCTLREETLNKISIGELRWSPGSRDTGALCCCRICAGRIRALG